MLGLDRPLVLSPMVDVTDAAFRSLAAEWGADVTCSEMVAAAGLVHGNATTWGLVEPWPGERPYGVQVMGGDPEQIGAAIRLVGERLAGRVDFLDLNLGCPSPNILRSCAGGFLLKDPRRAGDVMRAAKEACEATGIPHLSVKMRTGMDERHPTYLEVAAEAEAAGASWCTLHGRSVAQGYQGRADWDAIRRMVEASGIPVIGNGDLRSPADVVAMAEQTGCAGFFIARAAMNDPTVFRRMRAALDAGDAAPAPEAPGLDERLRAFDVYLDRAATIGITEIGPLRRQATRFVAGAPGAKRLRRDIHAARDVGGLRGVLRA